ncbi:MAG: hypothetical protein A2064_03295 [Spirochaetes bacterium GWB1_66_5]|nr:MAG: hypothetical protein A2064_03295 [Spirochaetes bacterium GWB1_66_5]
MKRFSLGAMGAFLCLLLLTALGGCAEFFEFNLLKSLDPVPLPSLEELAAMPEGQALDYLEEELGSPAFVEKLVEDSAVYGAVEGILYGAMSNPADAESRKRAAVLYADLQLEASGAVEVVNNLTQLLGQDLESLSFSTSEEVLAFLEDLIPQIMPGEALESREVFDGLLTGFQEAWQGYAVFGEMLGEDPAVPEAVNLGDVTQKALFSCLVAEALADGGLYGTEAEARDALWAILQGGQPADPTASGFEDPFQDGTPLQNILDAAGISF